jgi:hypothetical protein
MKKSIAESLFFSIIINVFVLYRINFEFNSVKGIIVLIILIVFGAIVHYLLWNLAFKRFIEFLKNKNSS